MTERYLIAGSLCLDMQDERLLVDGTPVRLGGRALAFLRVLMERPQVLLTKDELFARVWPGLTLSDAVLTTAVKEVRQAIGDRARQPTYIETAHGRGYRFLLPVERRDTVETPDPVKEPRAALRLPRIDWRVWAGVAAGVVAVALVVWFISARVDRGAPPAQRAAAPATSAHAKSIVVLPFEDFSPDGEERWFADGLAEEVQTTLARAPDLRVLSRTSAADLRRDGASGQEVAKQMGAAQFLEGTVRRSGDRVRVTAKLIRTGDGFEIWSQSYDRDMSDVISIQEDIAFQIASALKTVMDPSRLRVMVAAGTRSVEAYEAYLRGLSFDQRQLEAGDLAYAEEAAEAYERARTLDPNFAAAHWKSARTWFGNETRVDASTRADTPASVRLTRYLERADAAIATSRDDTEKLKYQAGRASMTMQIREAHRLMARYLAARPRDIDAWEEMADLSAYAAEVGWMRRAAERIHTLSVEEGNPRSRAITVSVMSMDLDAAVLRAREQLRLRPDRALTQYQAHRAFIWSGNVAEARALLPRIAASQLPPPTRLLAEMRQACAEGRVNDALALRSRVEDGTLSNQWLSAQVSGDMAEATAILKPLDTPDRLPSLMQFMINPTFDVRAYPLLAGELNRNGIVPRTPIPVPHGCPVQTTASR
ncbi:winged helix-turn-helix domain-containing protein [Brevundimonas lenta]|uniref:TolB-like protein/DNA-binding winged helix-turn-helix (WHTH) protein n=1 Tax=Brevundimonas lenta TaxID=424796 RepID=A0A7W6JE96_9CAUL|nr:winged helix-turn-helix domain-containing protein [Brevundimonas lenta]MBB4083543.1 TolB-like protein/DNA-binding winged helix-turn-helix (wHTH) protein [Brevundimonas lenta]